MSVNLNSNMNGAQTAGHRSCGAWQKLRFHFVDGGKGFEKGVISFNCLKDHIGCCEKNLWGGDRVEAGKPVRRQLSDLCKDDCGWNLQSLEQMKRKVEKCMCCI